MPQKNDQELTGKHVLLAMIAFFGVVVVVNVVFVRLAVKSFPGEEVEKSYYQGLNYNETLTENRRQRDTGWRVLLVTEPRLDQERHFDVKIVNADNQLVYDADVVGTLFRPTTDKGRQELQFERLDGGIFRAKVETISTGAWDLTINARKRDDDVNQFSATSRVIIE